MRDALGPNPEPYAHLFFVCEFRSVFDLQLYKVRLLRAAARYLRGRGGEGHMAVSDHARSA